MGTDPPPISKQSRASDAVALEPRLQYRLTAMSTSKPHLFNVSWFLTVRVAPLEIVPIMMTLATLCAFSGVLVVVVAARLKRRFVTGHRPLLHAFLVVFFGRTIPQVHFESGAALVE